MTTIDLIAHGETSMREMTEAENEGAGEEFYRHTFFASRTGPQECINCGAGDGELHTPGCACNDPDYDGDEPWDDGDE